MRFSLLLVVLLMFCGEAIAQSFARSSSSSSSSRPTKQNKCCFCVHPDEGQLDHDTFKAVCQNCLPRKFSGCDVTRTLPASNFTPEFLRSFNCASPLNWINLQHGPDLGYVVNQVEVCRSAYPTCSISVNDQPTGTMPRRKRRLS